MFRPRVVVGWLIRLVMIPVVARRHGPTHATAWLAPIFLFPRLGTLFYLWLERFGLRRTARRHREVRDRVRSGGPHRVPDEEAPEPRALVRLAGRMVAGRIGGFPLLGGNAVELLDGRGQMVERLVAEVDGARHHAHLLFYQYVDDDTGRRVAGALARAAARGVECRVLWDGWASRGSARLGAWMRERGVRVHTALAIRGVRQPLSRADVRNHRKIAVVDGRVAFTGSDNIHDADHALAHGSWHQISARVEGPAVLPLQTMFAEDWYFATGELLRGARVFPEPRAVGTVPVQAIPGGPSYPDHTVQHVWVQAIGEARESLVLTSPYLVPDEPILLALRLAALRGVDVRVVIPRRTTRPPADAAARGYFGPLLGAGVRICLHPSGILHAKTLSVDGAVALVGTSNLDRRSLFLNYEDVLLIFDRACTARLREIQHRYLEQAEPVDPDAFARRPLFEQYVQHTAKLLSPLL
jgi:cardiolipin synthase